MSTTRVDSELTSNSRQGLKRSRHPMNEGCGLGGLKNLLEDSPASSGGLTSDEG
ncbi:MAG: hypothetical protein QXP80_03880 [Zestosphaera sp.]